MHRFHRWAPALLSMVLLTLQSVASLAEDGIGIASSIKPNADGVMGANSQALSPGSKLYANETVRTGNLGRADLVFVDKTNLTVGPTSEVVLDKFVYDPTGSKSSVVLQATRGTFRFITGTQDHKAYAVDTPYGSLGVRGTTVELGVVQPTMLVKTRQCVVRVRLVSGAGASFRTRTGKVAELTEPGTCACITGGGDVVYSVCPSLFDEAAIEAPVPPPGTTPPTIPPCVTPNQRNCRP
jgi:hypothetical protein